MPSRLSFLTLIVAVVCSSCAMHVPMSETIMFHGNKPSYSGFGLSATRPLTSARLLQNAATRKYRDEEAASFRLEGNNLKKVGIGLYVGKYFSESRSAISTTLGLGVVGSDFTLNPWKDYFLTASGSFGGGFEFILQRPVLQHKSVDIAIGAAFRHELYTFTAQNYYPIEIGGYHQGCGSFLCGRDDYLKINSLGVRATGVFHSLEERTGGIRGTAYMGYSPALKGPVIVFSFNVGRF